MRVLEYNIKDLTIKNTTDFYANGKIKYKRTVDELRRWNARGQLISVQNTVKGYKKEYDYNEGKVYQIDLRNQKSEVCGAIYKITNGYFIEYNDHIKETVDDVGCVITSVKNKGEISEMSYYEYNMVYEYNDVKTLHIINATSEEVLQDRTTYSCYEVEDIDQEVLSQQKEEVKGQKSIAIYKKDGQGRMIASARILNNKVMAYVRKVSVISQHENEISRAHTQDLKLSEVIKETISQTIDSGGSIVILKDSIKERLVIDYYNKEGWNVWSECFDEGRLLEVRETKYSQVGSIEEYNVYHIPSNDSRALHELDND